MTGVLHDDEIDRLLATHVVGRIGCHHDDVTYVVPITYAYEDGAVYAHSTEGQKLDMMRANPHVCFEVDEVLDLSCWKSVIADGTFEELRGEDAAHAVELLLAAFRRFVGSTTAVPTHQHAPHPEDPTIQPVLYRIRLHERTGRSEVA
jgi:nitroimidazol reductase NimA-like FMN-containing flavoprotein (pyridoxamine 5'-phosphate oxidase superfamily)